MARRRHSDSPPSSSSQPLRWEWRSFGDDFGEAEQRICFHPRQALEEGRILYLLSRHTDHRITADGQRLLVERPSSFDDGDDEGLEAWRPVWLHPFPVGQETMREFADILGLGTGDGEEWSSVVAAENLLEIFSDHPDVVVVETAFRRGLYLVNDCVVELGELSFGGRPLRTVSVAMERRDRVLEAVKGLALGSYESSSHVAMLKRRLAFDSEISRPRRRISWSLFADC